jgi:hypothetical protein
MELPEKNPLRKREKEKEREKSGKEREGSRTFGE